MLYGSIDALEPVKLPSVIFLKNQDSDIQVGGFQDGVQVLYCVQPPLSFRSYIGPPIYWMATKIILDSPPGSHFESIVLVVGEIQTPVNLLLSDWTFMDGTELNYNFTNRLWRKAGNRIVTDKSIQRTFRGPFLVEKNLIKHMVVSG